MGEAIIIVLENEMFNIFWDFEIQMNHPIKTRGQNLVLIIKKKKNLWFRGFCFASKWLTESEGRRKFISGQRVGKAIEHEGDSETKIVGALGILSKNLENAANWHKWNIRLGMNGVGNCARYYRFTILTDTNCTNLNLSKKWYPWNSRGLWDGDWSPNLSKKTRLQS